MKKMTVSAHHLLAAMVAAWVFSPALAAGPSASSPEQVYQKSRAACLSGKSPQDRTTCLKEAGAAQTEARRARLGNGEEANALAANALLRCKVVAPKDRDACERMARGEGVVSGSVEGGGELKEITTYSVEPAASTPRSAPTSPR